MAAEPARLAPAPDADAAATQATSAVAILAGGCFWGVQGVFQHVAGVTNAVSGYAGGDEATADYEKVSAGRTKHAEAVRITYDPAKITYGRLLQIFFSVVHDPTELDRQGRVAVPAPLMQHAELTREIVVVGVRDRLEIWDRGAWERGLAELEGSAENVAERLVRDAR